MREITQLDCGTRYHSKHGRDWFCGSGNRGMIGSPPDPEAMRARFAGAYQVLTRAVAAQVFPGCAFGVLAKDEIVLHDGLGRFTYEPEARFVRPETVYDLASVTKVVATTAAAMLLSQRGQLDIDEQLGKLLPEFLEGRAADDPARVITLGHLLAHNSGLPGYVKFFETALTPDALLETCLGLGLEAEPGSRAEYSDPGFILLGRALEVAMGEPLAHLVRREISVPLGLPATRFCPEPEMRMAIPPTEEDTTFRRRRIQGEVQDENAYILGGVAGHAGLFSNVFDLLRFAREILNAGKAGGLFDQRTVEFFAQRQRPEGSSRALGWDTPSGKSSSGKYFSMHSIGHLGYSGCSLWIDLDAAIAVALLTNRTWPDRAGQKIREVRPAFHDAVREAL